MLVLLCLSITSLDCGAAENGEGEIKLKKKDDIVIIFNVSLLVYITIVLIRNY